MRITRTPLRISLIGGGTDMPAFYEKHAGHVFSFTINKYVYVSVNRKFDDKVRVSYSQTEIVNSTDDLKHDLARESLRLYKIMNGMEISSISDIPGNGTGLGSSSAFTVGLIKAIDPDIPHGILAERAFTVEANECHHPVGKQDQYASAYGGFNFFTFSAKNVRVEPVFPGQTWRAGLQDHCLLLWTGIARDANEILARQRSTFMNGGNVEIGLQLSRLAVDFHAEFIHGMQPARIGEFLGEAWKIKKFLASGISNNKIENWYDIAMRAGAYGGKILGAGGGGFLFFIAPPSTHAAIVQATGLRRIDINIEPEGSKVIYDG